MVRAILLNRILLVLAFLGLFVAGVLSMESIAGIVAPCGISKGCEKVALDSASHIMGVPVALLGFFTYAVLAALAIVRSVQGIHNTKALVTSGYLIALLGTIFSLYLQYRSFFVIHAVCPWCLTSAIIMVLTLIAYALLMQAVETSEAISTSAASADRRMFIALPIACVLAITAVTMSSKAAANKGNIGQPLTVDREKLLIPKDPHVFGPATAPITIVEFADMGCPSCQDAYPRIKEYAQSNPGKIKIIFRHFPLTIHELSTASAAMSELAAEKGKFWDFTGACMAMNREPKSVDELLVIAKEVGLDIEDVKKRLSNPNDKVYGIVTRDLNDGDRLGIHQTPTMFVVAPGLPTEVAGGHGVIDIIEGPAYHKLLHG